MHFAGIDYDFDILSTTNNEQFIKGRYKDQRVVTYAAKKPKKKLFTEEDLFVTDTFSFGTQIGQITNTCSTICALIPTFEAGSRHRTVLENRLKAGCAAQSRQIDKTKIGENVKTLGTICKQFQHINPEDTPEVIEDKMFYNSILADKKPYFFRYKYNFLNKEYNEYVKKNDENCVLHFSMTLKELLQKRDRGEELTDPQKVFLMYFDKFLPVIDSDCVMNRICKYIEGIDFKIKQKVRSSHDFDYKTLMSPNFNINKKLYIKIKEEIETAFKDWDKVAKDSIGKTLEKNSEIDNIGKKFNREMKYALLKNKLEEICFNEEQLANHLVYLFYEDHPSLSKSTLWNLVGRQIFENIKGKNEYFYFPIRNPNGSLEFLYENYSIERIQVNKEEEVIEDKIGEIEIEGEISID
jgi:hypothetical protein